MSNSIGIQNYMAFFVNIFRGKTKPIKALVNQNE
jgi:hypothetical protein